MADGKKDIVRIQRELTRQGWEIRDRGHLICYPPDKTKRIVVLSKTPSDNYAVTNALRDLRKSGANL